MSVALDRASALLVGALDVQSVSMASLAVPRWSDFVLLHRVKNGGEWQVSGELQSSDARWLKTAEVVLAPRTAKSQASQVSGCDGVNERDTGGRGVVAIRGGGGLSLGPEHTGPSVSGVDCTAAADRGGEPGGRACVGFDGGLGRVGLRVYLSDLEKRACSMGEPDVAFHDVVDLSVAQSTGPRGTLSGVSDPACVMTSIGCL